MFNVTTTTKSLLLVFVMLLAATSGALAAAPTVDTETTDTSTTTELNDGGTQAYNETTSSLLAWSADSASSAIEISQHGNTVFEASPDHYNSVSGTYYYNVSLADDGTDYSGLEVGAGESATLNVTLTNDTQASSPDTTTISYTFSNTEDRALMASENPESEGGTSIFGPLSLASINPLSNESENPEVGTVLATDSTTVTQNTDVVTLDTLNSNLTDAFAASTEGASEGDLIWSSYSQVSVDSGASQYVPVYYQRAGDQSWLNTTEDTYATISSDGETMTIHNPDALLDDGQSSGTLEVTAVGDEKLGFSNARSMLTDNYDVSGFNAAQAAFGAFDPLGSPEFVTETLGA